MRHLQDEIERNLAQLRQQSFSDFAALAQYNKQKNQIEWKYVSGNTNDRYLLMTIRPGQGLAGWVIRHGRNLIIDEASPGSRQKRLESPIMLAENLDSAILVPIPDSPAVLLLGNRNSRIYTPSIVNQVEAAAAKISNLFHKVNSV